MTHLPFVAGAYGLAIGLALFLSVSAGLRLRAAVRRIEALGDRRRRERP